MGTANLSLTSAHRALLGKLDVMGVRRRAAADQTRLSGDEFEMLAVDVHGPAC